LAWLLAALLLCFLGRERPRVWHLPTSPPPLIKKTPHPLAATLQTPTPIKKTNNSKKQCNYPSNYYSNKRWCCGDVPHLDLSVYAFAKLADVKVMFF
jgi:hypothetical protein